ncbi:MAG: putative DNA binding domain-containing protein [Proteobacteria bacterium]|nr:putative DNA binding domain-containing protein [Pseudomonadota bacterium]
MEREQANLEFKRQYIEDIKYTVVAFANSEGGRLLVGVEDDGSVCGVSDPDETMLRIMNTVRDSIRPDITLFTRCETIEMDGRCVVELTVQRGTSRPYYLSGKGIRPEGVYVRQGAASVPASETAILNMISETSGACYEEAVSLKQDLTFKKAEAYFRQKKVAFGEAQKRSLGLINSDGIYTNLALLLSDQCVHSVKLAVFDGSAKTVFRDRMEATGSLFEQIHQSFEFISRHNRLHSSFDGLERIDERDYPIEAIRESLLNAFIHRKYDIGGATLVSMFDDRLEFVTLGGLAPGIQQDDLGLGVSVLRNRNLANVFYRLHLIEAYGTGLMKIHECYAEASVKPKIEISSNAFKITLPNLHFRQPSANLPDAEETECLTERILALFQNKEALSRKEIESMLDISQTSAINALRALLDQGRIIRRGTGKNTRYVRG